MLLAVVFVYMICQPWEPLRRIAEHLFGAIVPCYTTQFYLGEMASFSAALNSGVNFLLFCLFGSKFRDALVGMFGPRQKNEDSPEANVSSDSASFNNLSKHI